MTDQERYNADVTIAEKVLQSWRRGSKLERALWLLNEKSAWNLKISAAVLEAVKDEGAELTEELDAILAAVSDLAGPGPAVGLNLSFGEPTEQQ